MSKTNHYMTKTNHLRIRNLNHNIIELHNITLNVNHIFKTSMIILNLYIYKM